MATKVIMHPPPGAASSAPSTGAPSSSDGIETPGRPGFRRRTLEHSGGGVRTHVTIDEPEIPGGAVVAPVGVVAAVVDPELAERVASFKAHASIQIEEGIARITRDHAEELEARRLAAAPVTTAPESKAERAARLRLELAAAESDAAGEAP